jgi:hypothetical protein
MHHCGRSLPLSTWKAKPLHILVPFAGAQFRADLLEVLRQQPAYSIPLRALSEHLRQLLAGWFTRGLLQLQRVHWNTCSGDLLEKIMRCVCVYERVCVGGYRGKEHSSMFVD